MGGRRRGAGRPKGSGGRITVEKEAARAKVRREVLKYLKPLVAAQIANAVGLKYLVTRDKRTGKFLRVTQAMARLAEGEESVEVWEKDPSVQAFTDLLNRALDKPAEQIQEVAHTGQLVIRCELP